MRESCFLTQNNARGAEKTFLVRKVFAFLNFLVILVTILLCCPVISNAKSILSIPSDAKQYNGHMYYAFKDSVTWNQAKILCESKGGHLVTITSKEENDFVYDLILNGATGHSWIGLTDERNEGEYSWVTNEEFIDIGESNLGSWDTTEDYVMIYVGSWNVLSWEETSLNVYGGLSYICEWEVGKIEGLKQVKGTTTSVAVEWLENSLVKKYIIFYYNSATKKYVKYDTVNHAHISISGLNGASSYKMAVAQVISNNGKNQVLDKFIFTVVTKPGRVKSLKINDNATLSWKKVNGADGYTIYSYNATEKKWSAFKTLKKTSYNLGTKLGALTQQYKVRAYKKSSDGVKFYGSYSNIVSR